MLQTDNADLHCKLLNVNVIERNILENHYIFISLVMLNVM